MTCISCGKEHNENYCSNCGEKGNNAPINFTSFIKDSFSIITNMDKGFLFNIKALFNNPKIFITEYLNGKRKGIFNPISFLFISITIYLIAANFLNVQKASSHIESSSNPLRSISYQIGVFIRTYLKYFWIFSIVPLAISLKLFLKRYNFTELLAVSCFFIGQATLLATVSHFCFRAPLIFDPVIYLFIMLQIYRVIKTQNKAESLLMAFANTIIFILLLIVVVVLIGIVKSLY
ncbi:DUF3667 domain-containing protein [Tenacibaculum crassostreae]|uniref:DUF3667 domain-containing protein n=1 Tax=Tenacibaculum crassostreae TaxID=502683 RepID=UPI0038954930